MKILLKMFKYAVTFLLACIISFIVIEGVSSLTLFTIDLCRNTSLPLAERVYTKYDSLLGWKNIPNIYLKNMFGPGISLSTNDQGFRNEHNIETTVPEGKIRIICSGDSFTFGYGVSNSDTWEKCLERLDPRIETVNMGQGGYGIDQSYLWFKEDGNGLDRDVHIVALITDDINRARYPTFFRYGKPVLRVENDVLVVKNVPVPKRWYFVPWVTRNLHIMWELRSFQLAKDLFRIFLPDKYATKVGGKKVYKGIASQVGAVKTDPIEEVLIKIFSSLKDMNMEKGSELIVVYLPTKEDHSGKNSDAWRKILSEILSAKGVSMIDLVEPFRNISENNIDSLFIEGDELSFRFAAGHYTPEGNEYFASLLFKALKRRPVLSPIQS